MSDELLARLDAGPTAIESWTKECYVDAAARIRTQAARIAELERAADAVVWFDWSNNDSDAVAAIAVLRAVLRAVEEGVGT